MNLILEWLYITVISFIANFLWFFYIKNVSESAGWKAAIFGELIVLCGCLVTYDFVKDIWLTVPMIIGGFFGTWLSPKIIKFFKKWRHKEHSK